MTRRQQFLDLAVSIFSLDVLELGRDLEELEAAGCTEIVLPIGDGLLAPLCCGTLLIARAHARFELAFHALLTVHHPERQIEGFIQSGCAKFTVQLEQCRHAHRLLHRIRAAGISPGVALSPGTPLLTLDYLLESVDHVVLLTHEPVAAAKDLSPAMLERIALLYENIRRRELPVRIGIYGGFTPWEAEQAIARGASYLLMETQALDGRNGMSPAERFVDLRQRLSRTGRALS